MDIEQAVKCILGEKAGGQIIAGMGINWAVIAAMAREDTEDSPTAVQAIKDWYAEQKTLSDAYTHS